jgi:hypothetical protein
VALVESTASARPKRHNTAALAVASPATTVSFTFSAHVSGLTKTAVSLTGSGQADFVNDALSATVEVPGSLARLIPGGNASGEAVDLVLSGGTVYAEVPGLSTFTGTPWISVALPASATSAIPGLFTEVAGALGNVNEILSFATAHHAKVTSLGSSTVDSTAVTGDQISARYDGVRIGARLWTATSGDLVQAVVGIGQGAHGALATVNLSGYGAPVTITVPSPSLVKAIPLSLVESVLGGLLSKAHLGALARL